MRISLKNILSSLALCLSLVAAASPVSGPDGSLWIGTRADGLLRIGRNGQQIRYSKPESVQTVLADPDGTIWVLADDGSLMTYRSTEGFSSFELGSPVKTIALSESGELLAVTRNREFFRWKPGSKPVAASLLLPVDTEEIIPSPDGAVWLLSEGSSMRISPDGILSEWAAEGAKVADSNLLPYSFKIESELKQEPLEGRFPVLLFCLAILLSLALGAALMLLLRPRETTRIPAPVPAPVKVAAPAPVHSPEKEEAQAVQAEVPRTAPSPESAPKPAPKPAPVPVTAQKPVVPERNPNALPTRRGEFYEKVMAVVRSRYTNPDFGVEDIAQELGMSRIHLNRKLQAEAGVSPSQLIKEERMQQAVRLLEERRLTVAQISAACGFSRHAYFSTAFKEFYGKTPSEYLESAI